MRTPPTATSSTSLDAQSKTSKSVSVSPNIGWFPTGIKQFSHIFSFIGFPKFGTCRAQFFISNCGSSWFISAAKVPQRARNWASSTTRTGLCHAVPSGAQLHRLPGYHQTAAASIFTSTSGTSVWNGEIWWNWIQFLGIKILLLHTIGVHGVHVTLYVSLLGGWMLHVRPSSGVQPCHLGKALGS
jgi:hypothetical protein